MTERVKCTKCDWTGTESRQYVYHHGCPECYEKNNGIESKLERMKTKIEIKSVSGKVLFEYQTENNTIAKTVTKAVQESENLSSADLSSADLSYADLRYADLSSADLSSADLSSADLSSAILRSANLSSAKLDKRYIQVSCIGSSKRMTTYCLDDDVIMCGCFTGTLEQFENQVKSTHKNNEQYLKEYLGFITYLKSLK
jgi:hypothetical protein